LFPQYQSPYLPQTQDHGAMGYNYGAPPPPQSYGGDGGQQSKRSDKKYTRIDDNYNSLEQVIFRV
jgi:E3 ubiquitin-protein ligase RGLG